MNLVAFVMGAFVGAFFICSCISLAMSTPKTARKLVEAFVSRLGLGGWVSLGEDSVTIACPRCGAVDMIVPPEEKDR